ncbi:MAG: ATP-dependent DNA helicase [Candidatus Anstonellaceae archaeon]
MAKSDELNQEKLEVLRHKDNTLVIANPGTGKTLLLAYKYASLVEQGIKPKDILCLTFTTKARKEMEDRIIQILQKKQLEVDYNNLNVYTFHSYSLENIAEQNIVDNDFLRYCIYRYIKEKNIFNYGEDYIIQTIVPKLENLIRYLKTFGIRADEIEIEEVKKNLILDERITKEEMEYFAQHFVQLYGFYETAKKQKGLDYADMLIEFLKLKKKPRYLHVLIDELQDLNLLEAEIALSSAEKYFAVGDKKQAIFGFQGGSITNFKKFNWPNTREFIIKENFRSTDQILKYSKSYFMKNTKEYSHKQELENLQNKEKMNGELPIVYKVDRENIERATCNLVKELKDKYPEYKIAILTRTNLQILRISRELEKNNIDYCSTYYATSYTAQMDVIRFLKALLSRNVEYIKNELINPFFPIDIKDALELTKKEKIALNDIYDKSPAFKKLQEGIKNILDVERVFEQLIIPNSIAYGKDYLLAAKKIKQAFAQAARELEDKSFEEIINYLRICELESQEPELTKQIILTTVHKAKGAQFDIVIYVPQKPQLSTSFEDKIVKTILKTKNIEVDEELEEESLRIDFVAFTRAKEKLFIITENLGQYYIDGLCVKKDCEINYEDNFGESERLKKAYTLFINGEIKKSQEVLKTKQKWVFDFIKDHFDNLDKLSYSYLVDDPCEYLKYNILELFEITEEIDFGAKIHRIAKAILEKEKIEIEEKYEPYVKNINKIIDQITRTYPQIFLTEKKLKISLKEIFDLKEDTILFEGRIDAIFTNGEEYLILDWKTDKRTDRGSEHRQQLEIYKKIFSKINKIDPQKIKVAIGYIGLKPIINSGKIEFLLDDRQPHKNALQTVYKKIEKILSWKKDPNKFFEDLEKEKPQDFISLYLLEEYKKENK